jgi:hypothetical protein
MGLGGLGLDSHWICIGYTLDNPLGLGLIYLD